MNIRINLYKSTVVAGGIAAPIVIGIDIAGAPAGRLHRLERRRMQLPDHFEKIAVLRTIRTEESGGLVRVLGVGRCVFAPEARRADELRDEARVTAFALPAPFLRRTETRSHHLYFSVAAWHVIVSEELQVAVVSTADSPPTAPAHHGGEVRLERDPSVLE